MRSGFARLMLVVDLLTAASKLFQWLVVEAEWFASFIGFETELDAQAYVSQFGLEACCSSFLGCLGTTVPIGA